MAPTVRPVPANVPNALTSSDEMAAEKVVGVFSSVPTYAKNALLPAAIPRLPVIVADPLLTTIGEAGSWLTLEKATTVPAGMMTPPDDT